MSENRSSSDRFSPFRIVEPAKRNNMAVIKFIGGLFLIDKVDTSTKEKLPVTLSDRWFAFKHYWKKDKRKLFRDMLRKLSGQPHWKGSHKPNDTAPNDILSR